MRNLKLFLGCYLVLCLALMVVPVSADQDVAIHGFVSQGYMKSSDNNFLADTDRGSFEFNEMGLNFSYDTGENVKVGAQLFARDLGDTGNDNVSVSWAYGDYKWRDWLGFRAGMMKLGTGLYNETRDVDSLRSSIFLPQGVYNEWFRDVGQGTKGLAFYGNVPLGPGGTLKYDAKVFNVQIPLDSGSAKFIKMRNPAVGEIYSFDFDKVYMLTLNWLTPVEGLVAGVSGYSTKSKYQANMYNPLAAAYVDVEIDNEYQRNYTYSLEYTYQNLTLSSEVLVTDRNTSSYAVGHPNNIYDKIISTNYYFRASYRFNDLFEAGAYYSYGTADDDGSGPANELKDYCLSAKFDITENMVFKLEGHSMDGLYGVEPDNDGKMDDSWMLYAAKVSYTF